MIKTRITHNQKKFYKTKYTLRHNKNPIIFYNTDKDNFITTMSCNSLDCFVAICSDTKLIKNGEKNENQEHNSFRSCCFWFNFF